jgi:hypothetical protein
MEPTSHISSDREPAAAYGPCQDCGRIHALPMGRAKEHARVVMRELETIQRLDYLVPEAQADARLSFENLFPAGRGNMFGVLECEDPAGQTVFIRAFSSLRDGIRRVDGWALPLLSAAMYDETILPAQREIKMLTARTKELDSSSRAFEEIRSRRADASRTLWKKMCESYRLQNFRGEVRSLGDAIWPPAPAPGGVGECCAPKLLNHAVLHELRPRSLAEFFWGEDGGSGGRVSGEFYPSCESRCRPILGFMLCGLEQ